MLLLLFTLCRWDHDKLVSKTGANKMNIINFNYLIHYTISSTIFVKIKVSDMKIGTEINRSTERLIL